MPLLSVKNLFKDYGNESFSVEVLKDITFDINEGDYIAVMGPSGSGKTTLMNILGCLDRQTSGEYIFDGVDIAKASENELSDIRLNKIGFVFQTFQLLSGDTALENVALPLIYAGVKKAERKERAAEALANVGLSDRTTFKPSQLSGGQKQRCAIARAMINHPKLLLADEPTGALDQTSGRQVMDLFKELNKQGVTIIMITHDANVAANARRIYKIIDGKLLPPEDNPLFEESVPEMIAEPKFDEAKAEEPVAEPEKADVPDEADFETEIVSDEEEIIEEVEEEVIPGRELPAAKEEFVEMAFSSVKLKPGEWKCPECGKINNLHFCGGCGIKNPFDGDIVIEMADLEEPKHFGGRRPRRIVGYANRRKALKAAKRCSRRFRYVSR